MIYDAKANLDVLKDFQRKRKVLDDISMEIVGGENTIDPLTLLRIYEQEVSIDNSLVLVQGFCRDRVVRFYKKGEPYQEFMIRTGDSVPEVFQDAPYLLDILCKTCYSLMLKKLTPPSEDSEKEE